MEAPIGVFKDGKKINDIEDDEHNIIPGAMTVEAMSIKVLLPFDSESITYRAALTKFLHPYLLLDKYEGKDRPKLGDKILVVDKEKCELIEIIVDQKHI